MVLSIYKHVKNGRLLDSTPLFLSYLIAVPTQIVIMQSANDSVRHGQNEEKEKNSNYWIEYLPFQKNFVM